MRTFVCFASAVWLLFSILDGSLVAAENVTCYQCTKNEDVECEPEFLLPCPSKYDRCAIHITKYASTGFVLKRECGLGPCDFNDSLMNNNLGMKCDRSKAEYSCLSCCKGNGCNRNSSQRSGLSWILLIVALLLIVVEVVNNYQPPYVSPSL